MSNGFNFTNVLLLTVGALFVIAGYYNKSISDIMGSILSGDLEGVFKATPTVKDVTSGSTGQSGFDGGGGFNGGGGGSW